MRQRGRQRSAQRHLTRVLLAAAAWIGWGFAVPVRAQQTLFNVPSADVLEAGKLYLEEDNLWRPGRPDDTYLTARAVVGLGCNLESGVNLGGFVVRGRTVPTGTLELKWQPLHTSEWSVTGGVQGLFYLRGGADGSPSAQLYGHAAWVPRDGTRITAGAWYATSGFADVGVTRGVLAGFEQRIARSLNFQADWFSGGNGIGYFTPGFALTLGKWVLYGGWSLKNGEPHENAALVEVGRYL
ncbi:MAG TPA: hypothetical protein VMT19_10810 [Thermoanaerobaculaceae bacterium]|nr:hypothetical protein [Thermoanaerobaculaceae bacterium]